MLVRRFTSSGAQLTAQPGGEFVLYSDYLKVMELMAKPMAPVAELRWQSVYNDLAEGLDGLYFWQADTPFGTYYELHWEHPGASRLLLNDQGEYYNYDEVLAMYGDLDVERDPYWKAVYMGTEDDQRADFPLADFATAKLFCENDYTIRVCGCLGVVPPGFSLVNSPKPRNLQGCNDPL